MTLVYGQVAIAPDVTIAAHFEVMERTARLATETSSGRHVVGSPPRAAFGYRIKGVDLPEQRPLVQAAGTTVCADVRIDNRADLFRSLGGSGHDGRSDAWLVHQCHQRWGTAAFPRVLGDFAVAIWDERRQRLLLARDAMGARPLYYAVTGGTLVFASDLEVLVAHPSVASKLDLGYTASELTVKPSFFHTTRTLRRGLLKLAPGQLLMFDRSGVRLRFFWSPDDAANAPRVGLAGAREEVRQLLDLAIDCRLPEGCVAAHVSGGLDSSAVFAVAAKRHANVTAISWSPPLHPSERACEGERSYVHQMAHEYGAPVSYTDLTGDDLLEMFTIDRTVFPFTGPYPEWTASRTAREIGASVVLSGWGGDELISGTGAGYLAELLRGGHIASVWRESSPPGAGLVRSLRRMYRRAVVPSVSMRRTPSLGIEWPAQLPAYLTPSFRQALAATPRLAALDTTERPGVSVMQLRALARGHLAARLEGWAALGYRRGIEYRFPLLDRRLVELALRLPGPAFHQSGERRSLFRAAASDLVPPAVLARTDKREPALSARIFEARAASAPAFYAAVEEQGNEVFIRRDLAAAQLRELTGGGDEHSLRVRSATWLAFVAEGVGY